MLSQKAIEFLEARGLCQETASRLGWYSEKNDLIIPYYRGDVIVNRKYRDLDQKRWRQDREGEKLVYNWNCLRDCEDKDLIVTEGEFDALALIQSGYPHTVSVPDGAPVEAHGTEYDGSKYDYLDGGSLKLMRDARSVILATDFDGPGRALASDLALRIGRAHCQFISYPKRDHKGSDICKDANETLLVWGAEALVETVNRAEWWSRPSVRKMSEVPPSPYRSAFMAGVDGFDDLFRFRMGDLSVWTGIPGHGKSTFVNHIMCSLAKEQGWQITFASFEQDTSTDHRRALRSWYLTAAPEHISSEGIAEADEWIDRQFTFVCSDLDEETEMLNLGWLIDCMKTAKFRHDCKVFVIDPWNELEHDKPRDKSLTEYVGEAIRALRRMARSLNIHIAVVAHPAKMKADDPIPGLYAISDSAHWANKPDLGAAVYRDMDSNVVTFKVLKCRYEVLGRVGHQHFLFNVMSRRYVAISDAEVQDRSDI